MENGGKHNPTRKVECRKNRRGGVGGFPPAQGEKVKHRDYFFGGDGFYKGGRMTTYVKHDTLPQENISKEENRETIRVTPSNPNRGGTRCSKKNGHASKEKPSKERK